MNKGSDCTGDHFYVRYPACPPVPANHSFFWSTSLAGKYTGTNFMHGYLMVLAFAVQFTALLRTVRLCDEQHWGGLTGFISLLEAGLYDNPL